MGTVLHRAVIVTSWDVERIGKARRLAGQRFGQLVSGLIPSPVNGYWTFFIASCGSKEGWDESRAHADALSEFEVELKRFGFGYEDGSSALELAFVTYGNDAEDDDLNVVRSRCSAQAPAEGEDANG